MISIILSSFLYSTNNNGLSLLLVSIILIIYLSKETLKRLFLSIKKSENVFIVCVNFLSIIALSLYLFWIKVIFFAYNLHITLCYYFFFRISIHNYQITGISSQLIISNFYNCIIRSF